RREPDAREAPLGVAQVEPAVDQQVRAAGSIGDMSDQAVALAAARERSEAKQLLELLVQQREDALRRARSVGAAVLVEDVHLARGAGLRDLHAVLRGLHLGVAREHAREQPALVLLGLG